MKNLLLACIVAGTVLSVPPTTHANITFPIPEEEPKPEEAEPKPDVVVDTTNGLLPGLLLSASAGLFGVWLARRLRASEPTLRPGWAGAVSQG
jgi:hypothetical protein